MMVAVHTHTSASDARVGEAATLVTSVQSRMPLV